LSYAPLCQFRVESITWVDQPVTDRTCPMKAVLAKVPTRKLVRFRNVEHALSRHDHSGKLSIPDDVVARILPSECVPIPHRIKNRKHLIAHRRSARTSRQGTEYVAAKSEPGSERFTTSRKWQIRWQCGDRRSTFWTSSRGRRESRPVKSYVR